MDGIITEMDKKDTPFSIFIDLSKAFDTLNHDILIQKLNFYGVTGIANDLIRNYLTNRKQFVEIDSFWSDSSDITTGVP